ncbi:hypothetical protein ACQUEC_12945, partial [Lactococcus lactis]|nr:hypothetical protein [Lactococcus lactis]
IIGNPRLNHRYRKGFYSLFKTLQQNLNCCSTFEFALGNKIPNASTCILHQDLVLRDVAYNFMECFFQTFEHTEDVHPSWECAVQNSNENPPRYYCILPNLNS